MNVCICMDRNSLWVSGMDQSKESNHKSRATAQKIPPRFEALTPLQHPLPDKFGWETVGSSGREQTRRLGRRGTCKKFPEGPISDHFSLPRLSPISG